MSTMNAQRQGGRGSVTPKRINMNIDSAILEELARAGMGRDYSDVIDAALRLSRLLASYKDKNGDVFIRSKQERSSTELVAVHAFEVA